MSAAQALIPKGRILVVPSGELDRLGRFQGFSTEADRYLGALLTPPHARFLPRAEAEDDPSYKQIIPYVVFRSGDLVFAYRRGVSQGEARLHHLLSIGVGGHVDEPDADGRATLDAYEVALRRELDEEVEVRAPGRLDRVGLINDDETPVGRVHLGAVHLYTLDRPEVVAREDGLVGAGFRSIDELRTLRGEMESWSRLTFDALFGPGAGA